MNDTALMTDVFKNAQTVASMDSTDRLAVIDNAGVLKGIVRTDAVNQDMAMTYTAGANSAGRWIRIAKMTDYGSSFILTATVKGFHSGWCYPLTMLVSAPHGSSTATMLVIPISQGKANLPNAHYPFSKIRISGKEGSKSIDIFVANPVAWTMRFSLGCAVYSQLVAPTENPTAGEYEKQFDVVDLWGGGNYISLNKLQFKRITFAGRRAA